MKKQLVWIFFAVFMVLLSPIRTLAIPIGGFSWDEYPEFDCSFFSLCGSYFSVENFSDTSGYPGSFTNVFVTLTLTGGGTDTLLYSDIQTGGISQSFDDLSALEILSASLNLDFDQPGTVFVASLQGPGSSTPIEFTPSPINAVPEPTTFLLVICGLVGIIVLHYRRGTVQM